MRSLLRLCLCVLPTALTAQPASSSLWYESRIDHRRWVYPGQRDSTVPWEPSGERVARLNVTESVLSNGVASTRIELMDRTKARIVLYLGSDGAIDRLDSIPLPTRPATANRLPYEMTPEVWDFGAIDDVFALLPALLRAPARTRDILVTPVQLMASGVNHFRAASGRYVTTYVSDSIVNGDTMMVLRDEGTLTWRTTTSFIERTLNGPRRNTRAVLGKRVSLRLYDLRRRRTVSWVDSLRFAGNERDSLPDGRLLRSPVRFDLQRSVALIDSATATMAIARADSASRLRFRRPQRFTMPPFDVKSASAADSLVRAHLAARTQAERDTIESYFGQFRMPSRTAQLAGNYLVLGDSARAARSVHIEGHEPFDPRSYEIIRPYLDDPERALRNGLSLNELYEAFEYAFKYYPPSIAADSLRAFCIPSFCKRIEEERAQAHEPRLRDIGLIASASRDPHRWGDTLIAYHKSGHTMLATMAARIVGGHAASSPTSTVPFPRASATWTEWLSWMRDAETPEARTREADLRLWVGGLDAPSLHLAMGYRGGGYRETLRQRFAEARVDSARFVYGRLLQTLGERRNAPQLFSAIDGGSDVDIALASIDAWALPFIDADSSTSSAVMSALLDHYIDRRPLWRPIGMTPRYQDWAASTTLTGYAFYHGAVIPSADTRLRAIGVVSAGPRRSAADPRVRGSFTLENVRTAGAFATVGIDFGNRGSTYLLVFVRGEWRLLGVSSGVE